VKVVEDVEVERIVEVRVRCKDGMEVFSKTVCCFLVGFSPGIVWLEEGCGTGFER
jgi:hypothetical protein